VIVPVLAIAGALAAKKRLPVTAAPCPRTGRCSSRLLIGTVLLVGLLNYVPALALGPVVEHLMLWPHRLKHRRTFMTKQKNSSMTGPRPGETRHRRGSFTKLDPRVQWRNPVMFVVYIGSILTTLLWLQPSGPGEGADSAGFILAVAVWLWFTVLFANFAEALAEGRSKAQAASLRGLKKSTWAKKLKEPKAPWREPGFPSRPENLRER
jgi:hypothetical protein